MADAKHWADELTDNLSKSVPIKAYPIRELVQSLRGSKVHITLKTLLEIKSVHNSKDISGILCQIEGENVSGLVCALTHLEIIKGQPHYDDILKYQKKRTKELIRQEQSNWE